MSEDLSQKNEQDKRPDSISGNGHKKRKIRIKYKERIRIKQRPKSHKAVRYLQKNRNKVLSYVILAALLATTLFMLGRLMVHRVEMNKLQKDINAQHFK